MMEASSQVQTNPPSPPAKQSALAKAKPAPPQGPPWYSKLWEQIAAYFVGEEPSFWVAMVPLLILSALLFTRHIASNYIFDEQEALLANPYVNGKSLGFLDAIRRDFWGLPPTRSVGSYRPLPNFVWRGVWDAQQWITYQLSRLPELALGSHAVPSPRYWLSIVFLAAHGLVLPGLAAGLTDRPFRGIQKPDKLWVLVAFLAVAGLVAVEGMTGTGPRLYALAGPALVVAIAVLAFPVFGISAALGCLWVLPLLAKIPPPPVPPAMQPWLFHWLNVLLHATNGAILVCLVFAVSKRRGLAWLAGVFFVTSAVITEAVSGVVGIADVMGGMGAVLALLALRLPMWGMPFCVFAGIVFGLFSKESALVCVPLVPFAALLLAPMLHPQRPHRWLRGLLALVASVGAFILYVELRKRWFDTPLAPELADALPADASMSKKASHAFMVWFHQASLPKDPLNNPLVKAEFPYRVAGALRVFWRGLVQVVFPHTLSGDYSYPQEPVPAKLCEVENVLGGLAMLGLPVGALVLWFRGMFVERWNRKALAKSLGIRPRDVQGGMMTSRLPTLSILGALGLMWIVVSYFPHSNIPVLLPTVRAERFWYFPVIGSSLALAAFFTWFYQRTRRHAHGAIAVGLCAAVLMFQAARSRMHAFDYKDDLVFWDATRKAVPNSAKAHLNYSVMWGARGRLDVRLNANKTALALAPEWPMAHIYLGDTLCRLHRADEAWPFYARGFDLSSGDPNLIALSLQCLWDESSLHKHREALTKLADKYPGSWLAYLVHDTLDNGEKNSGVDPKYRPRGYNEGPKE